LSRDSVVASSKVVLTIPLSYGNGQFSGVCQGKNLLTKGDHVDKITKFAKMAKID
jgi:hypothetical protein